MERVGTLINKLQEQFNQDERGYYDPQQNLIRLTEAADLSTFLHEFAHFMYEMELRTGGEIGQSINNWFKRNAEAVAKEANSYVGVEGDLAQSLASYPLAPKSEWWGDAYHRHHYFERQFEGDFHLVS